LNAIHSQTAAGHTAVSPFGIVHSDPQAPTTITLITQSINQSINQSIRDF